MVRIGAATLALSQLLLGCGLFRTDPFVNFDADLGDEVTVARVEAREVQLPGTDTCEHYIYEGGDFYCVLRVTHTSFDVIKNNGLPTRRLGRLLFPDRNGYILVTDLYDNEEGRRLFGLGKLKGEAVGQTRVECYGIADGVVTAVLNGTTSHYDLDLRPVKGRGGACTEFAR